MKPTAMLLSALLATGCAAAMRQAEGRPPGMAGAAGAGASPVPQEQAVAIVPLPGKLDAGLCFNSNSPEIVQQEGILLSTLAGDPAAHQDVAFTGAFTVFSHHIAKDETPGARELHLGLLATNPGAQPVTITRLQGASWLSQPDALFKPLDPLIPDPEGRVWAGPGDRVATDLMHGRSPLFPTTWTIPARGTALLYDLPIPTTVAILPPINGRTTQMRLEATGPVRLAEVAAFGKPTMADFQAVLMTNRLAGPRDLPAVPFDPAGPVPKGFRYGRVAGVSVGTRWAGTLAPVLDPGARVGVPVGALYLNKLGTGQNQSAAMKTRYGDTAYQAHGNYGVEYVLDLDLQNPDAAPRTYTLTLSHPARVVGDKPARAAVYLDPPGKPVMFRGPVRTRWAGHDAFTHLVLRHGEAMPPFATVEVPAGTAHLPVTVSLVYPADATPPQLLTIARER